MPSATAPLHVRDATVLGDTTDRVVTLATVLPLAWPALVRADGEIVLSLQTPGRSSDLGLDLAQALAAAFATEPGNPVADLGEPSSDGTRLVELLADVPLAVTVHAGFSWWLPGGPDPDGSVTAALERANASVVPTARLSGVEAAYWCRIGPKTHLRWALPYDEEPLLDALARLHVAGGLGLGAGSRYLGSFRAHGLSVPVWELSAEAEADVVQAPAADLDARLRAALADPRPLTPEERRARAGVVGRQLTLR